VTDSNDAALGVVEGVYADTRSGQQQWAAIRSGLFGTEVSLTSLAQGGVGQRHAPHPLQQARLAGHGGAILLTNYAHCTVAISTPGAEQDVGDESSEPTA
jgi:hypothetical protein